MGLFDDLPDVAPRGLFDDLPSVRPTTNPTPALPVSPASPPSLPGEVTGPELGAPPQSVMPAEQPTPAPLADMFATLPPAPQSDPVLDALLRLRAAVPETMHGQIDARLAEVNRQLGAEAEPQPPAQPLSDLGKRFMRGLTEIAAAMPETAAIVAGAGADARASDMRGGMSNRQRQIEDIRARLSSPDISDQERTFLTRRADDLQQGQAVLGGRLDTIEDRASRPISETKTFLAGEKIRQASLELFGTPDPQFDDRFIGKLAGGAGSMAGFVATTLLTGLAGGAIAGSGLNTSQMFNRARQAGANEEEAKTAAFLGSIIGATEVVPIGRALDLLPSSMRTRVAGAIGKRMANAFATAGEEGAQEAAVGIANNLIERGVFNPERGVFQDVGEEALIGAILGGGLGAIAPTQRVATSEPPKTGDEDEPGKLPEPPVPVGTGFPEGSSGNQTDPALGGRDAPRRPEGEDLAENPPAVGGPDQRSADLTPDETQGRPDAPEHEPAQPSPAAEAPAARPERRATVYTPDNEPVDVEYEVVEADSVLTSDQKGFDQSVQPRARERNKNSEIQIEGIANSPNFTRLYRAPETDRGAPVVGPDGLVESGNGRVIGLRRSYERGAANAYRQQLEAEFPEAAGMRQPIVIARRKTDVNREDFAVTSNRPATMALSATEDARADARMLDRDVLDLYRGGEITAAANRNMVLAFIGKLPQSEQSRMRNPEGGLTADGARRVRNAFVSRAYDSPDLLTRIAESVDDDMKGISAVLTDMAPRVAGLRAAMERGEVAREGDFIPTVVEAVGQIANFRARGENLRDFQAQIDAFAEPLPEDVQIVMGAMFNPAGTRLVSKKALSDFLEFAIQAAEAQDTTTDTMPGVEPVPLKSATEILENAQRKAESDTEQATLLDRAPDTGRRPDEGRKKERRASDDTGREEDAGTGRRETVDDAAGARVGRRPKGKLSPEFMRFSITSRSSIFDSAFVDAGLDPKVARLMEPEKQFEILKGMVEARYGFKVAAPKITVERKNRFGRKVKEDRPSLPPHKAVDQLLDAYQNLEMLSLSLGIAPRDLSLPIKGAPLVISLHGSLSGALGSFSYGPDGRVINMAGRSNSFAHEWGHALDHYLSDRLGMLTPRGKEGLLSREMDKGRVKDIPPALQDTAKAMVAIMNALYGDKAKLSELILRLQIEAAEVGKNGAATAKAKRAMKIMAGIQAGKRPPAPYLNRYFRSAAQFDDMTRSGGYYTDPAEMFARAFEAWTARAVAGLTDDPQSFLSKGQWAADESEDLRLSMTFPREADADAFAEAIGALMLAMNDAQILRKRTEALMGSAGFKQDITIIEPEKAPPSLLRRELRGFQDSWTQIAASVGKSPPMRVEEKLWHTIKMNLIHSGVGGLFDMAGRYEGQARKAITSIATKIGSNPGTGQKIGDTFQHKFEAEAIKKIMRIKRLAENNLGAESIKDKKMLQDVRDALNNRLRPDMPAGVVKFAAEVRGILNDLHYRLTNAGWQLGYVPGYLPHIHDNAKVDDNPKGFLKKANEVYRLLFNREVRDNPDLDGREADIRAIVRELKARTVGTTEGGRRPEPALHGPDADLVDRYLKLLSKIAALKKKADGETDADAEAKIDAQIDELIEQAGAIEGEVMDILEDRYAEHAAESWYVARGVGAIDDFGGAAEPGANFLKGRTLPPETSEIMAEFMVTDPMVLLNGYIFSAERKIAYGELFGAPTLEDNEGSKLKNMLDAARAAGVSATDIESVKTAVYAATGRVDRSAGSIARMHGRVATVGMFLTLPYATFSSLPETITLGLRSGSVRDSAYALFETLRNIPAKQRRRELRDLAYAIGAAAPYTADVFTENRTATDAIALSERNRKLIARFFQITGLTPLTNYQRSVLMPVANRIILRLLRHAVRGERTMINAARDVIAGGKGEFANDELNEIGIFEENREALLDWMESLGGLPNLSDLAGPDGQFSEAAEIWARAIRYILFQTVQNPTKADRPNWANHTALAPAFAIMSFMMSFHRQILLRTLRRGVDPEKGNLSPERLAKGAANIALAFAPAAALIAGHMLVQVLRDMASNWDEFEKLFDEWDDEEKRATNIERIFMIALTRAGLIGRFDLPVQVMTGIRYDADLTRVYAGAYYTSILQQAQAMISPLISRRNSPKTNTAEHNAVAAAWRGLAHPMIAATVSAYFPASPLLSWAGRAAIMSSGSYKAGPAVADQIVGPKHSEQPKGSKRYDGPAPWWELGDGILP